MHTYSRTHTKQPKNQACSSVKGVHARPLQERKTRGEKEGGGVSGILR